MPPTDSVSVDPRTLPAPAARIDVAPRRPARSLALRATLARYLWVALLPVAFVVYASSFHSFPVLDRKHSVLGDADAANFVLIVRDFSLTHRFGNEYARAPRTVGDNAQKHKIHHVVYGVVGNGVYRVLRPVYRLAGLSEHRAVYSVNAVIAVLNLVLLSFLLRRHNPAGNGAFPFLLLYAGALSTWCFSSVPESWPFSGTLVLAYLLLLGRRPFRPLTLAVVLGVIMLNNVYLAALGLLLALWIARTETRLGAVVGKTALAAGVSLASWLAGLTLVSFFDGSFRPDRFVHFTLWFKQFTDPTLPITSPYVWESAVSNLFVTSVVSNQPDPSVPQEALLSTLRGSPLGTAAVAAYLLLAAVAVVHLVRSVRATARSGGWRGVLQDASLDLPAWCVIMLAVTVVIFYMSGFLYSTVVVPILAVFLCRYLDLRVTWQRALLYGTLALLVANNVSQVLVFRDALQLLS